MKDRDKWTELTDQLFLMYKCMKIEPNKRDVVAICNDEKDPSACLILFKGNKKDCYLIGNIIRRLSP